MTSPVCNRSSAAISCSALWRSTAQSPRAAHAPWRYRRLSRSYRGSREPLLHASQRGWMHRAARAGERRADRPTATAGPGARRLTRLKQSKITAREFSLQSGNFTAPKVAVTVVSYDGPFGGRPGISTETWRILVEAHRFGVMSKAGAGFRRTCRNPVDTTAEGGWHASWPDESRNRSSPGDRPMRAAGDRFSLLIAKPQARSGSRRHRR